MKTLPKTETKKFFINDTCYEQMVSNFKTLASDPEKRKTLKSYDYFLYSLLRGKDWTKCFAKTLHRDPNQRKGIGYTEGTYCCWYMISSIFCSYLSKYYSTQIMWCRELLDMEYMKKYFAEFTSFTFYSAIEGTVDPYPEALHTAKEEVLV